MTVREYLKETKQDVVVRIILRILSKLNFLSKGSLEVIKSILDMDIEEFNKDVHS